MTKRARLVLEDCRIALQEARQIELWDSSNPQDQLRFESEWRRRWAAVFTLLRAVGHVLDKVDAAADLYLRAVCDSKYAGLKKEKLFSDFIEDERNLVLKEYRFPPVNSSYGRGGVGSIQSGGDTETARYGEVHMHVIRDGTFAGRSIAHVASEAIDMWQRYLDELDAEVRARRSLP